MQNVGYSFLKGAASGAFTGGVNGYMQASANNRNYFWGTSPNQWAYNRNQWSLAWWNKPDYITFTHDGNIYSDPELCWNKCLYYQYGNTIEYWNNLYEQPGTRIEKFRNLGWNVLRSDVTRDFINYNYILNHQNADGDIFYSVDNYRNLGDPHIMSVKKVRYVPNSRFDIQVYDPYDNTTYWINDFKNNTQLGVNPMLYFIIR
jgi:hypothetical protein